MTFLEVTVLSIVFTIEVFKLGLNFIKELPIEEREILASIFVVFSVCGAFLLGSIGLLPFWTGTLVFFMNIIPFSYYFLYIGGDRNGTD